LQRDGALDDERQPDHRGEPEQNIDDDFHVVPVTG
jgi:hypothetical protein